jgi:hypothetical protein
MDRVKPTNLVKLELLLEHQADPHKPVAIMGAADTGPNLL